MAVHKAADVTILVAAILALALDGPILSLFVRELAAHTAPCKARGALGLLWKRGNADPEGVGQGGD